MRFRLHTLQFACVARESIRFPATAANLFRGEFGRILHAEPDKYRRVFAPRGGGPSGLADPPRPFVLRARHLDSVTAARGDAFHFDVNYFARGVEEIVAAFRQLAFAEVPDVSTRAVALDLDPIAEPVERIVVRFLTPTELKVGSQTVDLPEFGILAARIRDRISTLRALYGEGPLDLDFRGFAERAARISMTRIETRWIERERRSGRTGQMHPLGGFVGEAEYAGNLREFVPYLEAAAFTGVGRQTVWGKGEISVER